MNKMLSMSVLLVLSIDTAQAISAAAGPGVMIVDTYVTQNFQGVDEYELVVQNTDMIPLRVHFAIEGDINNTHIMDVEFGDNDFILQPNKKRTVPIAFSPKVAGKYHGKILSSFSSVEETDEKTGADIGFAATTKVTINAYGEHPEGRIINVRVSDIGINEPLLIIAEFENTGDVAALPRLSAMITKNNGVVDTVSAARIEVPPYEKGVLNLTWDSTGEGTGNYIADVEIKLGDELLYDEKHNFSIVLQNIPESMHTAAHPATVDTDDNRASLTTYPFLTGFASALLLAFRKRAGKGGTNNKKLK